MTNFTAAASRRRDIGTAAFAVLLVVAVSACGQLATYPNLAPWYAGLAKPSFNPPNWVFAPVWSALYALMAFALWRILRLAPSPARRAALALFFLQLALNAAWSWMFFAAHSPLLGLINVVPQWLVDRGDRLPPSRGSTGWRPGASRRWRSGSATRPCSMQRCGG